tara:strand:- start:737 stop:952 length:216 start_codon:yes stop_codon:yes gene_type:complete
VKIYKILSIIALLLYGCSFDKSSNLWEYKKNNEEFVLSDEPSLTDNINFSEYKKNVINYSFNSDYPNINNK